MTTIEVKTMRNSILLLASVIPMLSGCFPSACVDSPSRGGVSELAENFATWSSSGVTSYVFTYTVNGFEENGFPSAANSNRVVVQSGSISQVEILNSNGVVVEQVSENRFSEFFTVDDLFEEISLLDDTVHSLQVAYDAFTGVPNDIFVDPVFGAEEVCGDNSDDFTITSQVEF